MGEVRSEGTNGMTVGSRHGFRMLGVGILAAALVAPLAAPAVIPDAEPIPSRVIVRFVDGLTDADRSGILAAHGAVAVRSIPELDAVVADVAVDPSRAILSLFDAPEVLSADLDRTRVATGTFEASADDARWALRRVSAGATDPRGFATLAILDTGVDISDENLTGQVMQGWSAFGRDPLADPNGHGTALAQIAAGSATDADPAAGIASRGVLVFPVQVLDAAGEGRDSDIIRGIVRAVDRGADVILMGFAGPGYSGALQSAIDYAWTRGAVLVAPAGDGATTAPLFPAGNARVVGVGATTGVDAAWRSSNRGPAVFVAAPGLEVPVGDRRSMTGTAAAAALVAGGAGLLAAEDRSASNAMVVGRLARGADAVGPRAEVGNGRIDLAASLADRSRIGVVPNGVLGGEGGPYVTTYLDGVAPLAGWAREHAAFLGDTAVPVTHDALATPVLVSSSSTAAPSLTTTLWFWGLAADPIAGGAVLQQRSFLLGSLLDDPLASDHGTFTYGSVSPPALQFGVLS